MDANMQSQNISLAIYKIIVSKNQYHSLTKFIVHANISFYNKCVLSEEKLHNSSLTHLLETKQFSFVHKSLMPKNMVYP